MFKVLVFCFLIFNHLYSDDFDFDGVEYINDKCLNTSLLDTVDIDGCPNNRLYFGTITLEYEYQIQNSTIDTTYINTYSLDINYKKYLFLYSKSYFKSDNISYNNDDYFSLGYMTNKYLFINKSYLGIKKPTNDYFLNTSFDFNKQNTIYSLFLQYTNTSEIDYITYNLSGSYLKNNTQYIIDYINSGSNTKYTNQYKDIRFSILYDFNKHIYSKVYYERSLENSDYNIGFNIGYSFD